MKRIISSVFAAAMTIVLGVMSAMAEGTYYLNSKDGLDSNDGLSSQTAFKTIKTAFNAAQNANGATIYIAPGDYNIDASGSSGQISPTTAVKFIGSSGNPNDVIIRQTKATTSGHRLFFVAASCTGFELRNVTLTGGCKPSGGGGSAIGMIAGRMSNCIITGNGTQGANYGATSAVYLSGTAIMENCLVYGNKNYYYSNAGAQVQVADSASYPGTHLIINCTIISGQENLPNLEVGASGLAINCAHFGGAAHKSSDNPANYKNCVSDLAIGTEANGCVQTTMAEAMDENYYPIALSPMIGGGSISYYQANAVSTVDLAGNARIVKEGTQLDIGCYQTDGTIPGPERPDDPTEPDDPPDDPTSGYAEHAGTPGTIGSLEYAPASVFANYAYTASPKQCKIAPKIFTDGNGNTFLTYQILNMDGVDVFSGFYISRWDAENNVWGEPKRCEVGDPVAEQRTSGQKKSVAYPEYVGYHNGKWYVFGNTTMYNDALTTLYQTYEDNKPFAWPVYMTFDPEQGDFTSCEPFDFPIENYALAYPFEQVVWKEDGHVLIPFYYSLKNNTKNYKVVVVEYSVDASTGKPTVVACGKTIDASASYSIGEPSLVKYGSKYYITIRLNDDDNTKPNKSGIWAVSDDGLNFSSPVEWNWDSDDEFFNMSTQQHWVKVGGELYLVYTRDNGSNSDILRHRAPLYMAKFDTEKGLLLKATEQAIVPKRGARLGNFYVSDISESEQWLITAEWMQDTASKPINPGAVAADNSLWIVRINDEIDETKVSAKVFGYSGDADGEAHACEVNVIYPTSGYTVKWAWNDTEDFTHDAPESYTEAGVYTNRVKVMASGLTDFIGQAVVTLEEYVEPEYPKRYMKGNDANNSSAFINRSGSWTDESGETSFNAPPVAGYDYILSGTHSLFLNNSSINFAGESLTVAEDFNSNGTVWNLSVTSGHSLTIPKFNVNGPITFRRANGSGESAYTIGEGQWKLGDTGDLVLQSGYAAGSTKLATQGQDISFNATLLGTGSFSYLLSCYANKTTADLYTLVFNSDLSGFKGKVSLRANQYNNGVPGTYNAQCAYNAAYVKFTTGAKFFGDIDTLDETSIDVGYLTLWFDENVTVGENRGWQFNSHRLGSGNYMYNFTPVIYVAEGKTVTIKGPVTFNLQHASNKFGLIKQGPGMLIFTNVAEEDEDKVSCAAGAENTVVFQKAGKCTLNFTINNPNLGRLEGSTSGDYDPEVAISVTAVPRDEECSFVRWEGDLPQGVDATNPVLAFTTDLTPRNITAIFEGVVRHSYTLQGNDSNGNWAFNGGRANAWKNELDELSQSIDATGYYFVEGAHTIYVYNNDFEFGGAKLTFAENSTNTWPMSSANGFVQNISNLVVNGNLTFNVGTGANTLTGSTWTVNDKLTVAPSCGQNTSSPFNFAAPLLGAGEFAVNYANYNASFSHKFVINAPVSNFTGKVTFSANAANAASSDNTGIEFPADVAFFGEPEEFAADSVELNYVQLIFNESMTIGANRGWTFNSRTIKVSAGGGKDNYLEQVPAIYVAEGKTVVLEGKVAFNTIDGSPNAGLIKKGPGTLIIKDIDDADTSKVKIDDVNGGFVWFEKGGQYGLAFSPNKSILGKVTGSATGYYTPGTEVTVMAVPRDEECWFVRWEGDLPEGISEEAKTNPTITFTTDAKSRSIVAVFDGAERHSYTLQGGDSGNFALIGNRNNAWKNENGELSTAIDSEGNYYVDGNNTIANNYNNDFTFAGHSLTFTANATDQTFAMSAYNNQKRQIDKLVVDGNLTFNSGTGDNVLTGETWVVNGKLAVTPSCGQGKSSPFTFAAPLFGAGEFAVNYVNYDSSIDHQFLITRDVSGFTGKVTLSANAANTASSDNTYIEFTEDAKFFGKAATPATNSVEVSYVRLVFDGDVTSDKNRGWTFKSRVIQTSSGGHTYNHNQIPVIYVAEGKTVTIKGPVTFECTSERQPYIEGSTYRLIKQGKGKLVFKDITDANRKLIYVEEGELEFPLSTLIMAW